MPDRDVPPDVATCTALDRGARLSWLVSTGARVRITHPLKGGNWEGVIIGLADHPTMLLRYDNGRVWPLPQAYAVEVVTDEAAADSGGEPAPGTFWERAVLERFARGEPVDLATVRWQVAALLHEHPPTDAPDGTEEHRDA